MAEFIKQVTEHVSSEYELHAFVVGRDEVKEDAGFKDVDRREGPKLLRFVEQRGDRSVGDKGGSWRLSDHL